MARRRRPPRPGGRPRGRRKRPRPRPAPAPVVPDTPSAKLEEDTRAAVARLMKSLLSEGGLVEDERLLARIIEQHPEHAGAFMDADKHFSSGDRASPFVHIGLHLIVERGVVSRSQKMSKVSSGKSWHDAVHEQATTVASELFGPEEKVSEEAS